jgi:hypothetical protein
MRVSGSLTFRSVVTECRMQDGTAEFAAHDETNIGDLLMTCVCVHHSP